MFKKSKYILLICFFVLSINISTIYSASQYNIENDFVIYSNKISNSKKLENLYDFSDQSFNERLGIKDSLQNSLEDSRELQIAQSVSNIDYPITPGDIFVLTYKVSNEVVTYDIQVDGQYNLDIPGFDMLNVKGYNYIKLKNAIIELIGQYYPFATTRLVLKSTGNFTVTVKGEVSSTIEVPCWGLSKLSDVVYSATKYASSRNIQIESRDGEVKNYDLYAALKEGDLSQNPLLKSGDVVTLYKALKLVTINGNVFRPGEYQLKDNEDLRKLIDSYAGGFLNSADTNSISVSRFNKQTGDYENLSPLLDENFQLENQDVVTINSVNKQYDSIVIEGAIKSNSSINSNTSTTILGMASGKLLYYFAPKENLSNVLASISSRLTSSSDLENSYIERGDKKIKVNLQQLFSGDFTSDIALMPSDILIIPFDQKFVNVQGAIINASSYAYAPDKTVNYYISLSGGLSSSATGTIKLFDKDGNRLDNDDFVPSESTIVVVQSNFQRNLTTTATVVGLVWTTIQIVKGVQELF